MLYFIRANAFLLSRNAPLSKFVSNSSQFWMNAVTTEFFERNRDGNCNSMEFFTQTVTWLTENSFSDALLTTGNTEIAVYLVGVKRAHFH